MWLAHHGILGQKWGVRRFQNEDGSLTPAGRERYLEVASYGSRDAKSGFSAEDGKKYGLSKGDKYDVLKKGSIIRRLTATSNEPIDEKRKYASITDKDYETYSEMRDMLTGKYARYDEHYKAKKDIKIANSEEVEKELYSRYGNVKASEFIKESTEYYGSKLSGKFAKKFLKEFGNSTVSDLKKFVSNLDKIAEESGGGFSSDVLYNMPSNIKKKYSKELTYGLLAKKSLNKFIGATTLNADTADVINKSLIKKGYDACIDLNDYTSGLAEYPIIFLNPKESLSFYKEVRE